MYIQKISNWLHRFFYPVRYVHINRYGTLVKAPANTKAVFSHLKVDIYNDDEEIELYICKVYDLFIGSIHMKINIRDNDVIIAV